MHKFKESTTKKKQCEQMWQFIISLHIIEIKEIFRCKIYITALIKCSNFCAIREIKNRHI